MKLFDLNIGVMLNNKDKVAKLILQDNYDVVVLQESMRKLNGNVKSMFNSCNALQEKTAYKNSFFGPLWYGTKEVENGKITADFGGCVEQGNQTLTNFPIVKASNVFYYLKYGMYEDATNFKKDDHPRAFTNTILDANGKELQIINVHGLWSKNKTGSLRTAKQLTAILKQIRFDIPSIVVGDFNLLPSTSQIKSLGKKLRNLIAENGIKSTRPSFDDGLDTGNIVCDYIFVNRLVKVNKFEVIQTNISDHYPLILDFDI